MNDEPCKCGKCDPSDIRRSFQRAGLVEPVLCSCGHELACHERGYFRCNVQGCACYAARTPGTVDTR